MPTTNGTPTPRTDAEMMSMKYGHVSADFARTLEREITELRKERDDAKENYLHCSTARDDWEGEAFKMQNERDTALAKLADAKGDEWKKRAHDNCDKWTRELGFKSGAFIEVIDAFKKQRTELFALRSACAAKDAPLRKTLGALGCGCGGDAGLCGQCSALYDEVTATLTP